MAAEHGAIGCLIYSDPKDDGYFEGEVYPAGPMRNKDGVQRGSVMDMPVHPGDPLTPNIGATRDARRLEVKDAPTIMKIPVLPISYGDAQPLLSAITGRLAPEDWRGALPITYRIGPGEATVRLALAFNWTVTPLYNVIARLPGTTLADEWILRGNHHDAWVNGAEDPVSGMAAELEEARALGRIAPPRLGAQAHHRLPRPGTAKSRACWARPSTSRHGPSSCSATPWSTSTPTATAAGTSAMGGSHALEGFINDVARDVTDPEAGVSVWKRAQALRIVSGTPAERQEARTAPQLRISALGSGSDYTPFLQHAGIASLNIGFGGEDEAGIYHSVYDSFHHYSQFQDRDFAYGRALAQTVGTAVIRLADADRLPFDFTSLADTVAVYVKELQDLHKTMQEEARERARQLDEGLFAAVNDPRRPLAAPPRLPVPPALNFAPLENAVTALTASAARLQKAGQAGAAASPDVLGRVNAILRTAERQVTDPAGLPGRPWFRHLLYAPGLYTGYGVKTLPGVREALEQKQFSAVEAEVVRAARAIERLAAHLDEASAALAPAGR